MQTETPEEKRQCESMSNLTMTMRDNLVEMNCPCTLYGGSRRSFAVTVLIQISPGRLQRKTSIISTRAQT